MAPVDANKPLTFRGKQIPCKSHLLFSSYTDDEWEFINAMAKAKLTTDKTARWDEVLRLCKMLGYRKVSTRKKGKRSMTAAQQKTCDDLKAKARAVCEPGTFLDTLEKLITDAVAAGPAIIADIEALIAAYG